MVTGDETLLRRAVDNLLRNSVFHNTGSVHIKLSLSVSAQSWSVSVADNGAGLPQAALAQNAAPRWEQLPQHGLGIVLVRQITRAHGRQGAVCQYPAGAVSAMLSFPRERVT